MKTYTNQDILNFSSVFGMAKVLNDGTVMDQAMLGDEELPGLSWFEFKDGSIIRHPSNRKETLDSLAAAREGAMVGYRKDNKSKIAPFAVKLADNKWNVIDWHPTYTADAL